MNKILIYGMLTKIRAQLSGSGIEEPQRLLITADKISDNLSGTAIDKNGKKFHSELKLSENSTFTDIVTQHLKSKLKYDTLDILKLDIDLENQEIQTDVYYTYKNEKLFLKLEKI